jgi:hypothetical protein
MQADGLPIQPVTCTLQSGIVDSLAATADIHSICVDLAGNLYVGGETRDSLGHYYVPKWDGNSWSALGGSSLNLNNWVVAITSDMNDNIYAAGSFTNTSGKRYVAQWDGTAWSELGGLNAMSPNNNIYTICTDISGNAYAAGQFTNASGNRLVLKYSMPTGMDDMNFTGQIKVYPNPADDFITLEFENPKEAEINVYNTYGQIILRNCLSDQHGRIDVGGLNRGLYFLEIKNKAGEMRIERLIKN